MKRIRTSKLLNMVKKSILMLVFALCLPSSLVSSEGTMLLNQASKSAFDTQNISPLQDLCFQELSQVLALADKGDDTSRLEKVVQIKVNSLYNGLLALAQNRVLEGQLNIAIALLNGLYSKLREYRDPSAWGRLILAASPSLQAQ